MSIDPMTGIRILDATLDYSDTSEDRVLATIERATDRSSESDELAQAIVDWPTRYHFSRMRAHLVQPVSLRPGMEVLDVGCGTGAVTRALGERGADVLGIEGALPRARAAALRCGDLDNVEIVCGDISHLETERTFDLVCLVGVLEYAATREGGEHGPETLLDHLRKLVKPGGALLVAIENQIGLKYLLGYREDHVALPWAGIEDYAEGFGARTWSRLQLNDLLANAGFGAQRWFFPYPDYKLPSVILSEGVYELENASEFVDQIVRQPVQDFAFSRTILADDRRVHDVFLRAGLGPDIANSFLVLAGSDDPSIEQFIDPHSLAWILGGERRHLWKKTQVVCQGENGLRVTAQPNSDDKGDRTDRWLTQRPVRNDPWHRGPTLEQTALESCHSRDEHGLVVALKRWMRCLEEAKVQTAEHSTSHPFSPAPEAPSLPDDMLDVSLSNFVLSGEKVVFVDREWRVDGGVDLGLAGLRALWFFVLDLINGGARHPWSDDLTVDTVCLKMAAICGLPAQQSDLDRMYSAEAELQSLVIGFDSERVTRDLRGSGQATLANPNACCPTRWTHLHKYAQSTSESESVDPNQLVQNQARIDQLEKSLASANALAADLETSLSKSHDHALSTTVEHQQNLSSLQKKNEALQTKLSALEAQVPIKIYQRLRWWFSGR